MFIASCDVNNIVYCKELFNFKYQLQEEAGSAEEQPASNKADAYTIVKGVEQSAPFYLYYR
jgi:hypothetical protein